MNQVPILRSIAPTLPVAPREGLLLVLLALALHGAIVFGVQRSSRNTAPHRIEQEIELLRTEPPPQVITPPPPPPPELPRPQPRVLEPVHAAPPAALRTEAAQDPVPDTMRVTQNLTAPQRTGPVEAVPTPVVPAPHVEELTEPNAFAGYLNNPAPVYPKAAQRMGMQGHVLLRVLVLGSGKVGAVEVRQSSGKSILDEAAVTAVKGWTFAPAKRGSTPVDAWTQVPIDFRLAS